MQQALANALVALRRPGDDRPVELRRWLHRIAHNAAIDLLRHAPAPWAELDERIDGVPRPPEVAEGRERLRRTVAGLLALPERQRRALLLHAFEGLSWEEIARELGTQEGAVRQLLHRARGNLRGACAGIVAPFWLLKAHVARAAGVLAPAGASGKAVVAGVAAVSAIAGGVTVVHGGGPAAPVARVAVASAAPRPAPAGGAGHTASVLSAPGLRAVHHHARVHTHRPAGHVHRTTVPSTAPAPAAKTPAPTTHEEPASSKRPDPSTTTGPAPTHEPATGTPATPAQSAPPATTPASEPAQPASPPDGGGDPAPAQPAAPPAIGHVAHYEQSASYGGPLRIEGLPEGTVDAYIGELTTLRCVFVRGGHVTHSGACPPSRLVAGTQVSQAQHGTNDQGNPVWTLVELLVPDPAA